MSSPFIVDKDFKGIDYTKDSLPKGAYENCIFECCNFSDGFLDNQNFMECSFVDCNLSNTNIKHTSFKEVKFEHSKMIGLKFEDCNDFLMSFTFDHCILNLSSFYQLELKRQNFNSCKLIGTDFTEAVMTSAVFKDCDLENAIFDGTVLEHADLSSAYHYSIDPERNSLKKAIFSKDGIAGLLSKYELRII